MARNTTTALFLVLLSLSLVLCLYVPSVDSAASDVVKALTATGNHTILLSKLQISGLINVLDSILVNPTTILAPEDEAWKPPRASRPLLGLLSTNLVALNKTLSYHVLKRRLTFSQLIALKSRTWIETYLPTQYEIVRQHGPASPTIGAAGTPGLHIGKPDIYADATTVVHSIGYISLPNLLV
eukprot:TRINITY_DN1680_c0_g1_i3.p1 TRINITY_DN1680_c0_g1~~TRINITY_DN1680_c0_g1_i3.p1  ORF type:complete len:183 (+),score=3.38 TRINITY_DN1680_c0_g1_i3:103-651(+)